ncbi:hypothetical protein SGFS_072540 [Streptomyces graminofaciens]|uniref:Uncharacterized protein n=1 Tax=Streptomyces graminofaciens TaxID=68212 RepID=A0ABN5VTT4_9ACTN|nr:hypothetical protein SGFS_072540 [Streptomyces graminofaciens]
MATRVDLARRGDDVRAVVQRDGDGGGGGIQSEQEHANSLRRFGPAHGRPGTRPLCCYRHKRRRTYQRWYVRRYERWGTEGGQ